MTAITMDPVAVAIDRVALELNQGPIRISPAGPDWGDAEIAQYMAEAARGQVPVDFRIPNRTISLPLVLGADGPAGFAGALRNLQAKVALFQSEGGWLGRGTNRYCDVVNAALKLPDRNGHLGVEGDVVLTLEAIPDFYGDWIQLADHPGTAGAAELVFTEIDIQGDHDARVRIVVDNDSSSDQLGALFGIRSRNYSGASTARPFYQAEALTPLDVAAVATVAGASGGQAIAHTASRTSWVNILSTDLLSGGPMTHVGSYRLWARAKSTGTTPPYLRAVYGVGDLTTPEENAGVQLPGADQFYLVDLGEIRLDKAPVGPHRWQGRIQGKRVTGGETITVDKVWMVPADDAYGAMRAPQIQQPPGALSASDDFTGTTAGNALNGRTAPLGGSWVTSGGDADDFTFADSVDDLLSECITRPQAGGDTGPRWAVLGSNFGAARIDCKLMQGGVGASAASPVEWGLIARWIDSSNHLFAYFTKYSGGAFPTPQVKQLVIKQVVGGVTTTLATVSLDPNGFTSGVRFMRLTVTNGGRATFQLLSADQTIEQASVSAISTALATGGALATGKPGIYDRHVSGAVRGYDDFGVSPLDRMDAIMYAGRSLELRTDGNYRQNHDATGNGRVPYGDLPRLPVAGLEDRTVEIFLKPSRGDLQTLPDAGLDEISARVYYRPSWLILP